MGELSIDALDERLERPRGPGAQSVRARSQSLYRAALDTNCLRSARIGVAREKFFGYSDVTDRIASAAIERMKELGAVIVDPANIPNAGAYDASELKVLLYEFKADLDNDLGALGPAAKVHSLADVIAFNEANRSREMTDKAYRDALAKNVRLSRKEGIDAVMDRLHLDALVAPTNNPPWTTDLVNGDHRMANGSRSAQTGEGRRGIFFGSSPMPVVG